MEHRLFVKEVKRDSARRIVWIWIQYFMANKLEYEVIFMPVSGKKLKLYKKVISTSIPDDIYRKLLRKAYAIFLDKRARPPVQPELPLK